MEQTLTLEGRDTVTSEESGRVEEIGRLFDRHHNRLYKLALRLTWRHDEAADLVQECFLRAIEHRVPDDPIFAERWLARVLVNLCRDSRRRDVVRRAHERQPLHATSVEVHDPGINAAVRDAVLRLPAKQRAVIVLHEVEGRTLREVAEILGVAAVTARWHLHVALRSLRKELSR